MEEEDLAEGKEAQTAVYVIRRNAGENHDRRAVKGDYYLSDMELSNIKKVAAAFEHTVIVLNSCVIDANFIEETAGIDGALLLGQAGMEAGNALADVLTGKVSPSGHLTDTWAKTVTTYRKIMWKTFMSATVTLILLMWSRFIRLVMVFPIAGRNMKSQACRQTGRR